VLCETLDDVDSQYTPSMEGSDSESEASVSSDSESSESGFHAAPGSSVLEAIRAKAASGNGTRKTTVKSREHRAPVRCAKS
jgi:hypothetical protein